MSIAPRDILIWMGGSALSKFGSFDRKTAPINRGGEDLIETFTRAAPDAYSLNRNGVLVPATTNIPRVGWYDGDGDGVREPYWPLEANRSNLCIQSSNFGLTWAAVGTPTRAGAAHTASGVSLDLIGDDAAGTLEGYTQTITFTGNAVKAISVYFKQDTSTSSVIRLRDTSAGADRLLAVITWSGSIPVITMTTGTNLLAPFAESLGNGVWRADLQTTSVTAANTNSLQVYPATDAALAIAATGTIYMGGVQAENATFPSSLIPTTTISLTRGLDQAVITNVYQPMAACFYVRFIEFGSVGLGGNTRVFNLGNTAGTGAYIRIESSGSFYQAVYTDGTTPRTATLAVAPAFGSLVELLLTITSAGVIQLEQSVNRAASTITGAQPATALPSGWADSPLWLNSMASTNAGYMALGTFIKTRGSGFSLTDFRTLIA